MNKEKIKIAIIGCGRIAGHHCRAISESNEFELVAICDLVVGKAKEYAKQFGALAYENYHQMLKENPQINTVAVITPSGMHYEHVMDVLRRYEKYYRRETNIYEAKSGDFCVCVGCRS